MKKIIVLIIFIFVFLFGSFTSVYGLDRTKDNNDLIFDYSFTMPIIEKIEKNDIFYDKVSISGLNSFIDFNKPSLPVKPLKILLPSGKDVKNIHVIVSDGICLGEGFNIEVGGGLIPIASAVQNAPFFDNIDSKVDLSDYSSSIFSNLGVY